MRLVHKEKLEDGRLYLAGAPEGVCSQMMEVLVQNGTIQRVQITGGCGGNTQGVSRLLEGMTLEQGIAKIKGIDCGGKGTSCPDQLSMLLEMALNEN